MATVENDVLVQRKDKNGNTVLDYPYTRTKNVFDASYNRLDTIIETLTERIDKATETAQSGNDGWSPVLAVVNDGERRVCRVNDWTGGTGIKPSAGKYIGANGLVDGIGNAVDIRGSIGTDGKQGVAGADGLPGNAPFALTVATSTAPTGARVGDSVINSGTATRVIGGLSMAIGAVGTITSISPFTVTAAGNIRGATGTAGSAGQLFNPDFDGLIGRSGFKLVTTYPENQIVKTITYIPTSLVLATRTKTYNANDTITTVTAFQARTIAIDGVTINTLAKTDTVTFNPSSMTTQ